MGSIYDEDYDPTKDNFEVCSPAIASKEVLDKQVGEWRKEVERLKDLIAHATGTPPATTGGANATPTGCADAPHSGASTAREAVLDEVIDALTKRFVVKDEPWVAIGIVRALKGSVGASTAFMPTVLTDERIIDLMAPELLKGDGGYLVDIFPEYVIAAGRAIEREVSAQAGHVAVPEDDARDAARWRFMMRVADDADGLEAEAMESLGNEQMETDRPESEQMCELVDQAIAKVAAPSPAKESK